MYIRLGDPKDIAATPCLEHCQRSSSLMNNPQLLGEPNAIRMGYPMVYWCADTKRGELKFRCPHVCGKVGCPQGSSWCSSSNYGMVVKCKIADDLQGHSLPRRTNRNGKKFYNLRTSVECVFSRLKKMLGANFLKVRGIQKVTAHLTLCCIVLLAGMLALSRNQSKSVA